MRARLAAERELLDLADLAAQTEAEREQVTLERELYHRRRDVVLERARSTLAGFIEWTHPGYTMAPFHTDLSARVEQGLATIGQADVGPRILIVAPPQHGKSTITIAAIVWLMARHRGLRVGYATYSASLSREQARLARMLASSEAVAELFPGAVVRQRSSKLRPDDPMRAEEFYAWGSSFLAVGRGGGLTGRPLTVLVVDDLLKDYAEAMSPAIREAAWKWFGTVATSRLQRGAAVLGIGTRWHADDPLSRLERSGDYQVLRYAAIAEQDEGWRAAGEALAPHLHPLALLAAKRIPLTDRDWMTVYQGHPIKGAASFIPDSSLRFYDTAPEVMAEGAQVWITLDTGGKADPTADPTVAHVWAWWPQRALEPERMALLDRAELRGASIEQAKGMLRRLWARWGGRIVAQVGGVLIEDVAIGAAVLQQGVPAADGEPGIPTARLRSFNPSAATPGTDKSKIARAQHLRGLAQRGRVWVPQPYLLAGMDTLLSTWEGFPTVRHDEDIDCASMLILDRTAPAEAGLTMDRLRGLAALADRLR